MRFRVRVRWSEGSERVLMGMAGFSAAAHLAAAVLLSVIPRFIPPPELPKTTIAEIVPASALFARAPSGGQQDATALPLSDSTPSQRAEAARKAASQEPPEKPAPRPEKPDKKPAAKKIDKTVPPLAPKKDKRETPPVEPSSSGTSDPVETQDTSRAPEPATSPGPAGISFGGSASGAGIPSIGSSAFPYDYYRSSLVAILQSNWRRPVAPEGVGQAVSCRIQFTILKSGIIQQPRVASPSGNDALDASALRAVYDSNPLPPLPFQYGHASVSAEVVFELTGDE